MGTLAAHGYPSGEEWFPLRPSDDGDGCAVQPLHFLGVERELALEVELLVLVDPYFAARPITP
jgi:hypothetical protein